MKNFHVIVFIICWFMALSLMAYANISIAEYQKISEEATTENEAVILSKTIELLSVSDADIQSFAEPFEQDGLLFTVRDVIRDEAESERLTRTTVKTSVAYSDTDDVEVIRSQFPLTINCHEDGYSGQLHLDTSTIKSETARFEMLTYTYHESQELTGLEHNDPTLFDEGFNGMELSSVSFKQETDGLYTATANYEKSVTELCPVSYVTTAEYTGEIEKILPGEVLYTIVYEGVQAEYKNTVSDTLDSCYMWFSGAVNNAVKFVLNAIPDIQFDAISPLTILLCAIAAFIVILCLWAIIPRKGDDYVPLEEYKAKE